ncbi:HAD domain-containing protein [Bacteroides caecimuris]|uniref:HAD domain-containing protein n=1 Tax=Bacteroides caecimuris TaxID=1796613 RepID=UPI00138EDD5C
MFSSLNFLFRRSVKHYDKIIFLDFDGVLAINNPRLCDVPKHDRYGTVFNLHCVDYLCQIINDTSAKIVVTSSWTNYLSLRKINQMWRDRNLPGTVIDTIRNDSIDRSIKIDNWLKKYKVTKYVIIDDMDFNQFDKHHHQHLVTTSSLTGLSEIDIVRVCMTLKK